MKIHLRFGMHRDVELIHSIKRLLDGLVIPANILRIVDECRPTWFLLENVPAVPDVVVDGYAVQRFGLTDLECGGLQWRNRHFQFGHEDGWIIRPPRVTELAQPVSAALASDGKRRRRPDVRTLRTV